FFINDEGYIVTNNHVIANGDNIVVRIPDDKNDYKAKLVGADPKTDIALIKIEPKHKITTLPLGDSESLEVGEWVVAIGNQFQLGQTFTAGIVSAKSRRVPSRSGGPYDQFIQTDASINPGSSGGPLLNTKGQVVGINTAIFSPGRQGFGGGQTGFNIGIGFSVPINLAKSILVQLKENGRVTRGLLGVIIQAVTVDIKEALGLKAAKGALVAEVLEDTPAYEQGFEREDVIIKFNGKTIEDHDDLPLLVANTPTGTTVSVVVLRQGKELTLNPTIGELKDAPKRRVGNDFQPEPDYLGLIVEEISSRYSKAIGQDSPTGVVVTEVTPNSASDKGGVLRGDVIEEFNRRPVKSVGEYERALKNLRKDQVVLVLIRRKEGTRYVTIRAPKTAKG
ncbi:MAG: trypsin-like peptidase domain-containing protein, partial [Bdellovibrionales bacterium]|nr:trypsin-like peptidase domain-containing protein [Bdellovibrionales bacterium]